MVVFLSLTLFGDIPGSVGSARGQCQGVSAGIPRAGCAQEYRTLWSCSLAPSQAGIDLV